MNADTAATAAMHTILRQQQDRALRCPVLSVIPDPRMVTSKPAVDGHGVNVGVDITVRVRVNQVEADGVMAAAVQGRLWLVAEVS